MLLQYGTDFLRTGLTLEGIGKERFANVRNLGVASYCAAIRQMRSLGTVHIGGFITASAMEPVANFIHIVAEPKQL